MEPPSTPDRILDATRQVLARSGPRRLSLTDVATAAGVSRPTLYRWFPSKEVLLEAFGRHEQERFDGVVADAVVGLRGLDRLDRVLQVIVEFQSESFLPTMAEVEPERLLVELTRALPQTRAQLEPYFSGPDARTTATIVARVALSHAWLPDDDPDTFLHELRVASGIARRRRVTTRPRTGVGGARSAG